MFFGSVVSPHTLDHQTALGQSVPEVFIPQSAASPKPYSLSRCSAASRTRFWSMSWAA